MPICANPSINSTFPCILVTLPGLYNAHPHSSLCFAALSCGVNDTFLVLLFCICLFPPPFVWKVTRTFLCLVEIFQFYSISSLFHFTSVSIWVRVIHETLSNVSRGYMTRIFRGFNRTNSQIYFRYWQSLNNTFIFLQHFHGLLPKTLNRVWLLELKYFRNLIQWRTDGENICTYQVWVRLLYCFCFCMVCPYLNCSINTDGHIYNPGIQHLYRKAIISATLFTLIVAITQLFETTPSYNCVSTVSKNSLNSGVGLSLGLQLP